jgi:DNA-directed RNA polymerase specialized sigma24 family protein
MNTLTTSFVKRLRDRDETAWFELWQVFGPVLRAQLSKWGKGRIGAETVRDLTQETLAALSDSIDRYDPSRGARFSTWLLSIAKHALGDEIDRRMALKRGGGRKPAEFDERFMAQSAAVEADEVYEQNVFRAKVYASMSLTASRVRMLPSSWASASRRSAGTCSGSASCSVGAWPRPSPRTASRKTSSARRREPASAMTTACSMTRCGRSITSSRG